MTGTGVSIEFFVELQARNEKARHDAEVRMVASFDTDAKRAVYLDGVYESRGRAAYENLRIDVWNYMKAVGRAPAPQQQGLL